MLADKNNFRGQKKRKKEYKSFFYHTIRIERKLSKDILSLVNDIQYWKV